MGDGDLELAACGRPATERPDVGVRHGRGLPAGSSILIISSYYEPELAGNAPYVTGLAQHLAAAGREVTVVTGFPHYPEWRSSARGRFAARSREGGVEIRRRWHYVPRRQSAATRAAYEATLCAFGATALPRKAPDLIIGVSPTLAAATLARAASSRYGRPYGLIYQDLQGLGASQSGVRGGARIARLVELAEVSLARQAAAVGVIAEGFMPYFVGHGVAAERIHRLRNWSRYAAPTESVVRARARLGWSPEDFVCLHAGNMGHKQGLENLLRAAAEIDDPRVRIVFAGEGNERLRLEELARRLRLSNVSFVAPQPPGLYEAMLAAADVLIVNQRASVGDMSLASKLTSYFMAARPVVGAVAETSETGRELRAAGAGRVAAPDDPVALAEALRWMQDHPEEARALARSGRRYAEANLTPAAALAGYERFLEEIRVGAAPSVARRAANAAAPVPLGEEHEGVQLSCLIVSYTARDLLLRCLASLEAEREVCTLEVVLVDNASDDGTIPEVQRRFPWVRVVENDENVGFAQAANTAMRLARGRFLLHLNPDMIVPPGALQAAVAELERRPDVGMLGGKLVRLDGTFDHACKRGAPTIASSLYYFFGLSRLLPRSRRFAHYTAGELDPDASGYVEAVSGAFMLVRREAVEAVGRLDERFWLYGEDLDWCARFREHSWKIFYFPEVEVVHVKGGSGGGQRSWAPTVAFHRSMWLYYDKHLAPRHSRAFAVLVRCGIWANFVGGLAARKLGGARERLVGRGDRSGRASG